jgi:hypothetical protein
VTQGPDHGLVSFNIFSFPFVRCLTIDFILVEEACVEIGAMDVFRDLRGNINFVKIGVLVFLFCL